MKPSSPLVGIPYDPYNSPCSLLVRGVDHGSYGPVSIILTVACMALATLVSSPKTAKAARSCSRALYLGCAATSGKNMYYLGFVVLQQEARSQKVNTYAAEQPKYSELFYILSDC